jgi:hypothetical protein
MIGGNDQLAQPFSGQFWAAPGGCEVMPNLAPFVQVVPIADDLVCEQWVLDPTYGILGPTARTQTGNVHRLGGEH